MLQTSDVSHFLVASGPWSQESSSPDPSIFSHEQQSRVSFGVSHFPSIIKTKCHATIGGKTVMSILSFIVDSPVLFSKEEVL